MSSNIKVSVITPIYNHKAEYLKTCLESLHTQTLNEIEFILIDNGATQESKDIIAEYEKIDSRFKVIRLKKNVGYSALNIGIDSAQGEYIGIVESDDYIEPDMFFELYSFTQNGNIDIVKSQYWEQHGLQKKFICPFLKYDLNKVMNIKQFSSFIFQHIAPWSMLYKKDLLKSFGIKIRDNEDGNIGKDIGFVLKALLAAKKIYLTDKGYYHYNMINPNQSMKNNNTSYIVNMVINEYKYLYKWFSKYLSTDNKDFLGIIDKRKFFNLYCHFKKQKCSKKDIIKISNELKTIKDFSLFSNEEKAICCELCNDPIKYYCKIKNLEKPVKKLFSIQNSSDQTHKIINFLGLKIKVRRKVANGHINQSVLINEIRNILREEVSQIVTREVSTALMVQKLHIQTFPQFKNINVGKDVAIIGCGPTVKFYNSEIDAVNIALNKSILLENVNFKYLFSWDYGGFKKYNELDFFENVKKMDCIKFYGKFLSEMNDEIPVYPDDLEHKIYHFYSSARHRLPARNYGRTIHTDIETHPLADFMSISFAALHFALYTQPEKIYLIGLDTTNSGHILNCQHEYYVNDLMQGYKKFKEHINKFYPHIEIISVNPVGLKGMFRDVYTQSYVKEHPDLLEENVEILHESVFKEEAACV